MAQAKQGDTVKVNYTGKFEDGNVFDSSEGREPLEFTVGQHQVIPGFEDAVVGMSPGETKTVTIPAEQAYGPWQEDLAITVSKSEFPQDMPIRTGDRLQLQDPEGNVMLATITDETDTSVTLDANHPLAGEDLTFDVTLVEIVGK